MTYALVNEHGEWTSTDLVLDAGKLARHGANYVSHLPLTQVRARGSREHSSANKHMFAGTRAPRCQVPIKLGRT
jgi:hypothetical protein